MTEIKSPQPAPKHTPGPWEATMWTDHVAGASGWSLAANGHLVPTNDFETDDPEEAEANARLMSAAPELLAALQAVAAGLDTLENRAKTRAAIAKATGAQA